MTLFNEMTVMPSKDFLVFYLLFLLAATLERVSNTFLDNKTNERGVVYHKWAFTVPFITYLLIVTSSIFEFFLKSGFIHTPISLLGFFLFIMGVFLRRKAIKDLGSNWSVYIEIKKNHKLIKTGIYKLMKHPYCIAVLCELGGVCLIPNAFFSVMLIFAVQIPLLLIRIRLEETVLLTNLRKVSTR